MTETVQPTAPAVSAPVSYPAPQEGDTKRAYLVRLGLAVAVDKNGIAPRGRFSKEANAALAQHASFPFADVKPPRKARVAKTTAPQESVAEVAQRVRTGSVLIAPLPQAPAVVRSEGRAWGFFGGRKNKG